MNNYLMFHHSIVCHFVPLIFAEVRNYCDGNAMETDQDTGEDT